MKKIGRKAAERIFENAIRCFGTDHNAITGESVNYVSDLTDVKMVWYKNTKVSMYETSDTTYVFVVTRTYGYDRYEIRTVAMCE